MAPEIWRTSANWRRNWTWNRRCQFILGRNMFGPVRGACLDYSWKGWWGGNPPYHAPTFVLTHYEREPVVMEGGTSFYFVTG